MKKLIRVLALAMTSLFIAGILAACGDNTAAPAATTAAPVATTAAAAAATTAATATTAAAATTAATATTAAAAATTAATATTAAAAATTAATATTAAAAATTAAGAASGATSGTIRIYSSLPLTGSSKQQSDTLVNAMKLAISDATGGTNKIGNFTIDYVPLDDATAAAGQWDPSQEGSNANKAASDPDAMVYLGPFNSGAAKVSIPLLNQANLAMISPSNTAIGLTKPFGQGEPDIYYPTKVRNYFRVVPADDLQGPGGAEFMKTLNVKKVYVIDDSQAYGVGLAKAFIAYCPTAGLECTSKASITGKESNYDSLADQIKASNPDGIYFAGITQQQADKLIGAIRKKGIDKPFVGADGILEKAFIDAAGPAAEGVYATVAGIQLDKLGPKGKKFVSDFQAKFGKVEAYTIYGYEAMSVALSAIKSAGVKDRAAIIKALSNVKDFDGVLGKWSFDKNGDINLGGFLVDQVKNGEWVEITAVQPKALNS